MADFRVVLVEPSFEESIGFVARAMKNFGLSNLHLVNPKTVLGPSGRMRGGHAQDVLDSIVEHRSVKDALEGLHLSIGTSAQRSYAASNLVRKPMTPRDLGNVLRDQAGTVGIVFGREGTGLTNVELGQCDATLTIPSVSEYQTLNLSHAAAIVFYELHPGRSLPQNKSRKQFSGSCPTRLSSREWKSMIAPCSQEPLGMFWEDQQFDIAKGACWLRCCVESRRL